MSCCGDRRRQATISPPVSTRQLITPVTHARPAPSPAALGTVRLRYLSGTPTVLRGPVTRRAYHVGANAAVLVDGRDAPKLLATGRFAQE